MFIGTQCDLWGKPDGTEHDKNKSREISSTYFYALIPVYLSGNNSIGNRTILPQGEAWPPSHGNRENAADVSASDLV